MIFLGGFLCARAAGRYDYSRGPHLKITLIAIGTKMPHWVVEAYLEYSKRLPLECALKLVEISTDKRTKNTDIARLVAQEGARIIAAIPKGDYVVALTERGKLWNTREFSSQLQGWQQSGQNISLLVGGPDGLAAAVLEKADQQWSLSPLTWPHPLVRVMLAEQIYRAWSLLSHHPYHR
jgi:23S rRNA (pseudouridine1915-N3)-methyltransferase